ncbi:MAG: HK97 family phage prohead protease [Henriciella sp.]|nr:HK97 family phage prohead protease [Henriciella sp.]
MNVAARQSPRPLRSLLIEGYASRFGVADASGDVVRAGAFSQSLRRGAVPMLLQHRGGAIAGHWNRMVEDGHGLYVRGLVESPTAQSLIAEHGLDGLSIGFRPRVWVPRGDRGRTLADIELVEVSLVAEPMLSTARFRVI